MKMKRTLLTLLLALSLLPLSAQERTDTAYVFRFVPEKDMFYVPYSGNGEELARLEACVERHKAAILAGETPLHVDGYCGSAASEADNLAIAKLRSNRVKSELITRSGLTEACFVTHNHSGEGDYVTVRLVVPVATDKAEAEAAEQARLEAEKRAEAERIEAEKRAEQQRIAQERAAQEQAEREAAEKAEAERLAAEEAARQAKTERLAAAKRTTGDYTLALRTNLLHWATLTPDLGLEWRINLSWGILVNGSWTSWSWNNKDRKYALWEVSPEVRWYLGKEKRGYIGAMYKAGQFNYKLSATGRQGDLMGGGITGGYQLRLNKALSMDFNLGIGCLHADYEKYTVIDGVRVRAGKESKNWWGPVSAGVTLVWQLF